MTTKTTFAIHNLICGPDRKYSKIVNTFKVTESSIEDYAEIVYCFMNDYSFKPVIGYEDINGNISYNSIVVAVLIDVIETLKKEKIVLPGYDDIIPQNYPFARIEDFDIDFIIIKPSEKDKYDLQYFSKY